jgi:hypothetical protein
MSDKQHQEDTKYVQWQDGMYVMLDDLLCDYEKALVENSLRTSLFYKWGWLFSKIGEETNLGVTLKIAGIWCDEGLKTKLTREQALYIATCDADI